GKTGSAAASCQLMCLHGDLRHCPAARVGSKGPMRRSAFTAGEKVTFEEGPEESDRVLHGVPAKGTVAHLAQLRLALVAVVGDAAQDQGLFGVGLLRNSRHYAARLHFEGQVGPITAFELLNEGRGSPDEGT